MNLFAFNNNHDRIVFFSTRYPEIFERVTILSFNADIFKTMQLAEHAVVYLIDERYFLVTKSRTSDIAKDNDSVRQRLCKSFLGFDVTIGGYIRNPADQTFFDLKFGNSPPLALINLGKISVDF